jgi:hypothetical protein
MANDEKDFEEEHKNQRNLGSNGDLESARSAEKLRETAKMIDHDNKSSNFNIAHNKTEHEPATVNRDHDNPEIIDKRKSFAGILLGRPIVILLIIGAIVLGVFLVYTQIQYSNQEYKIENFNALWNQSLTDLRNGNTTIDEYCVNRVHDNDLCNRFNNLQYMG